MGKRILVLMLSGFCLLFFGGAFAKDSGRSKITAACGLCGDVNGDGQVDLADLTSISNYLFRGSSVNCPEQADVDDYESITIRDIVWLIVYSSEGGACGGQPPICPPKNPPLAPAVLQTDTLKVNARVMPAGESTAAVQVEYRNVDSLSAFGLPLKFRVDNQIPLIGTVIKGPRFRFGHTIADSGSGELQFVYGQVNFGIRPGSDTMLTVYLSIPPASFARGITVDTTEFFPKHPLFLDVASTCYSPVLPVFCFAKPGDANATGTYTMADAVCMVNYIFDKPGCTAGPGCWLSNSICRGDWNGDGNVAVGDVIQAVNFIFNKPGGPWNPVPSGVCCL